MTDQRRSGPTLRVLGLLALWLLATALWPRVAAAEPAAALPVAAHQYDQVWTTEQPFPRASRDVTVNVGTVVDLPAPQDASAWQALGLPAVVQRPPVQAPLQGSLVAQWLRVAHPLPATGTGPLALYIPRVESAAVQVAVHDGQQWRIVWDGVAQWREQWNRPVLVDLGEPQAGQRVLQVAVGLVHVTGRELRVTRLTLGPRAALQDEAAWRQALQITAPQVGSLTFLVMGVFALMVWRGRRIDHSYLLFFLSSLVWFLGNLHYYSRMPTDWPTYRLYWWMTDASLSWTMALIYLFALRFDHRRIPALEKALLVFVVAMSVLTLPRDWLHLHTQVQQHMVNAVVALLVLGRLTVWAWRGGSREVRVITGALWVTDLMGVHDLLFVANVVGPESIYLLPFASLVLVLAFLFAVQTRYSRALGDVARANAELEHKLAQREAEVRANQERIAGIEQQQALLLERQRLMRDMHDGLGSTLMSSLVLVEQGKVDLPAVAELLRECVDDLRLVIDSLEPLGQDLVTLLASLRHRLGRRLEGAGLRMHWDVEDLPPLEWMQPHDALQVLRIVQEVLTNVLKHAQAATVRLATRAHHDSVTVLIEDDGAGFDLAQEVRGRGVRHLHQRASRLGGRVILDSAKGQGTRVRLELPLQRRPQS